MLILSGHSAFLKQRIGRGGMERVWELECYWTDAVLLISAITFHQTSWTESVDGLLLQRERFDKNAEWRSIRLKVDCLTSISCHFNSLVDTRARQTLPNFPFKMPFERSCRQSLQARSFPLQRWGPVDLPLRASNEGLLRPRVARAQETKRLPSHSLLHLISLTNVADDDELSNDIGQRRWIS